MKDHNHLMVKPDVSGVIKNNSEVTDFTPGEDEMKTFVSGTVLL